MTNINSSEDLKRYIYENKLQGHICISNDKLFPASIEHGIYGFPHSGRIGTKSYWRAISSLYNIGNNDIIFFHRTSGNNPGCKVKGGYGFSRGPHHRRYQVRILE